MYDKQDHRSQNHMRGSHHELYELEREQRSASLVIRYGLASVAFVILAVLISGQAYPKDRAMRIQANRIERAIQQYYSEEMDYPESLADVSQYLLLDGQPLLEPYASQPISDCGTDAFSAESCTGMVHYERLESGDSSGYCLTIFGRKGVLDTRWGGQTR
ncbi:hypothetical protein KDL44_08635 [bacterium]|nr:hypothetical protein [bacterium]